MKPITFTLPAAVTNVDPNTGVNRKQSFTVPLSLPNSDTVPTRAIVATDNGAAETLVIELWSRVEPSGGWVRTGALSLTAIDRTAKLVVPVDAGAPTVFPGETYLRVTTAPTAETKLVLQLT